MHTFLLRAVPHTVGTRINPSQEQAIFACVARGSMEAAEGAILGELHRAGWKVLEVFDSVLVQQRLPGLKRHPSVANAMAAARQRGMAFLLLDLDIS